MAIYFDNAATSHPKPAAVAAAMVGYLEDIGASPGRGSYRAARRAERCITETRELLAQKLHINRPNHLCFSMNATAALNTVIRGLLVSSDHVVTTSYEHNSVLRPLERLARTSQVSYSIVRPRLDALIYPEDIAAKLQPNTRLVIVNHASNVNGAVAPISEIANLCRERKVLLLVDGAQTAGTLDVNLTDLDVDFFAFTGHKALLGPSGIGCLYMKDPDTLEQLVDGGTGGNSQALIQPQTLPDKFEAGTPNYIGIAGLAASLRLQRRPSHINRLQKERALCDRATERLRNISHVSVLPFPAKFRVPLLSFNVDGMYPGEVGKILDRVHDIAVRVGLHCAPEAHRALGTFPNGAVRISFGPYNTQTHVDVLIRAIQEIATMSAQSKLVCA